MNQNDALKLAWEALIFARDSQGHLNHYVSVAGHRDGERDPHNCRRCYFEDVLEQLSTAIRFLPGESVRLAYLPASTIESTGETGA